MEMKFTCTCGNKQTINIREPVNNIKHSDVIREGKPIYFWTETPDKIMIKCLDCNKEFEL